MPEVKLKLAVRAPIERVWEILIDIERYPDTMDHVRSVQILESGERERRVAWSVLLKGSVLEWVEEEHLDPEGHSIRFNQLSGDLEFFDGHWELKAVDRGETTVSFEVMFEIGIPPLAEMLNPVAQRSLHENCTKMLSDIEQRTAVE